jgi:hypothetical protein
MHVSRIVLDFEAWYRRDEVRRTALRYASTVTSPQAARLRVRLDGRPRINRRDFVTFDDGVPGTHFVSLQRTLEDFNATRAVMNAADGPHHHPDVGLRATNCINAFMQVVSRATFVVPPRAQRAYPGQPFTSAEHVSQAA